jgi:hypothetical protein
MYRSYYELQLIRNALSQRRMNHSVWIQSIETVYLKYCTLDMIAQEVAHYRQMGSALSGSDTAGSIISVSGFPYMLSAVALLIAFLGPIAILEDVYLLCKLGICAIVMKPVVEKPCVCIMILCQHLAHARSFSQSIRTHLLWARQSQGLIVRLS